MRGKPLFYLAQSRSPELRKTRELFWYSGEHTNGFGWNPKMGSRELAHPSRCPEYSSKTFIDLVSILNDGSFSVVNLWARVSETRVT